MEEMKVLKKELPEVPYNVWTTFGPSVKSITMFDNHVSLSGDGDYKTLEQTREAITWYVKQFGGTVKWQKM